MATQKMWILGMLMATLNASLFGHLSAGQRSQFRNNKLGTGKGTTPAQGF